MQVRRKKLERPFCSAISLRHEDDLPSGLFEQMPQTIYYELEAGATSCEGALEGDGSKGEPVGHLCEVRKNGLVDPFRFLLCSLHSEREVAPR